MVLILVHSSTTCTLYTGKLTGLKLGVCLFYCQLICFWNFAHCQSSRWPSLRYTLVIIFLAILSRRVKKALVNTDGQIDVASFVFNLYNSIGFYRYTFYIDIFYNYAFHYDYILFFLKGGGAVLLVITQSFIFYIDIVCFRFNVCIP